MLILAIHVHLHLFHHVRGPAFDYIGVGVAAFVSWAGLPGPGESLLLAAGIFAAKHKLDIAPLLLVAWGGATAGGIVGWLVGLVAGHRLLTAPGPFRSFRLDTLAKGEKAFKRMEAVAIVLTPTWVAGIYQAGPGIYNLVNTTSAAAWAVAIGVGGYYAGPPVLEVVNDFGAAGTVVAIALVVVAVAATLLARWRGVAKRQARREAAPGGAAGESR